MDRALRHAKARAKALSRCSVTYIVHISLKELGISSSKDGFHYTKSAVVMLCENPTQKLTHGVYTAVGLQRDPFADDNQVEQSIRKAIQDAWKDRDVPTWEYYFPIGKTGRSECPSNRDFLMAIVDFVELWKAFCEEVNYGKQ